MSEKLGISPEKDPPDQKKTSDQSTQESKLAAWWDGINRLGISGPVIRIGTTILTLAVIIASVIILGNFFLPSENAGGNTEANTNTTSRTGDTLVEGVATPEGLTPEELLDDITPYGSAYFGGIPRIALPETIIPSRPRVDVTTYTVQAGDNLFDIAEIYGLKPETILWGNEELRGNPAFLYPDQELIILPVDGTYHQYHIGETLFMIAEFYGVSVSAIIEWPSNGLDPYETDPNNPNIADGTWLIIPGGEQETVDWGPPPISRENPAVALGYGAGSCGEIYEGPIGTGTFTWPSPGNYLSGYDFTPGIHEAIDIGGAEGNAVWATDNGVVVYAGWSNYGYGNLIVIDHGNGWQSAYAHLLSFNVGCGAGVYQGTTIGALGNTGNSSGAHLHFELRLNGIRVNPWYYLVGGP